jgi:hypothetical protein
MATRSQYVSRLRRAFLLRTHPDRFRSPEVRKQQATLVQAISDRMARPDFMIYAYGTVPDDATSLTSHTPYPSSLPYVLEQKGGALINHSLNLNAGVERVLQSMVAALQQTAGLTNLPPPPKAPHPSQTEQQQSNDRIHWTRPDGGARTTAGGKGAHQHSSGKYNIHSNQGRDLKRFLETLDATEMEERKASRMDVTATAVAIRQVYRFAAVDGTSLGWSSASLAILLRTLVDLHHEHHGKFLVDTFYPLRLVWSSEDFRSGPLDLFGGILYLNPASTPIQWLNHLLLVTPDALERHQLYRSELTEASRHVNTSLEVTFHKGHSCSSREYYEVMMRLAQFTAEASSSESAAASGGLTLERVQVMVESPQACRRAILTREGHVRVGASMTNEAIVLGVTHHRKEARTRVAQVRNVKQTAKETIQQMQGEFGLQRVYRSNMVQVEQFVPCLLRLLEQREEWRATFAGKSVGIVGAGHFCHLGDDGSLMIPFDWK